MQNKLNGKTKHIFIICISAVVVVSSVFASVMSGCTDSSDNTGETKVQKETQIVTSIVDATYATDSEGNTVTDEGESDENKNSSNKNSSSKNESSANSSSSSGSSSHSNNDKQTSSEVNNAISGNNTSNNNSSSAGSTNNNSSSSNSSANKPVNDSNACYIDGEKFAKGDTVTCVYKIKSPEKLENYQATINYDSKYLSVKSARLSDKASSGGILNFKLTDKIKFNGSNVSSGYDFTKSSDFVIVNYVVESAGNTKTDIDIEVVTGVSGKSYAKNNNPANGLKITKSYS